MSVIDAGRDSDGPDPMERLISSRWCRRLLPRTVISGSLEEILVNSHYVVHLLHLHTDAKADH